MHTDRSIDYGNMEFTYIRILFRLKKEGDSDIQLNLEYILLNKIN